jgi:predicted CXXCH cytochrome family protein
MIHKPLQEGQCMNCHNPHGGFDRNMLRSKSMGELCMTCHKDPTANHKSIHGPVAAGACGACHQPHMSNNEHLLVRTGKELCVGCHQEMGEQLKTIRFPHKPVADNDCTKCHDPHASDTPSVLRDQPLKLCTTECHQDIKKAAFDAKFKHEAVTEGRACVNCHTAHGGDLAKLLKSQPIDICMKCHDKSIPQEGGKAIASVADITKPGMSLHGPLREGSCGGCHNVHGSDFSRLLTQEYPVQFYAPFKVDSYGLCFTCHDKQLALQKTTDALTGFRNGDTNLHYLHVNKDPRGRTCRACHSTHASTQDMHVRESVPYGQWSLPVSFKPTTTGGSCSPGCHKPYSYDRKQPVLYDAPQATETKTP